MPGTKPSYDGTRSSYLSPPEAKGDAMMGLAYREGNARYCHTPPIRKTQYRRYETHSTDFEKRTVLTSHRYGSRAIYINDWY
eukprot:2183325-Rhodomonas_salina.2